MRILNLTDGARIIALPRADVTIRPRKMSVDFNCTPAVFNSLITSNDYQNCYRFTMDASERSMLDEFKVIKGVVITTEEADDIIKQLDAGKKIGRIDINGDPEVKVEPKTDATFKFKNDFLTALISKADKYKQNELINPSKLEVKYSSSNEDVATIDENGKVTLVSKGKVDIIASTEGNEKHNPAEAKFTIEVQ